MREFELVEFMYILFGVGIVMLAYYPHMVNAMLPFIALIGGFYFVWGIFSHMVGGLFGVAGGRRDDWWNGIAILTVLVLIFGQGELATNSVFFFINAIWSVFVGAFALAL